MIRVSFRSARLTVACAALAVAAAITGGGLTAVAHPSVDVAVANFKFTPAVVEAHVGEPTTLRFAASEGVHGVQSEELGIPSTTISPGKVTEVSFTPKKAGTYELHCSIVCGAGHEKMLITVKVAK